MIIDEWEQHARATNEGFAHSMQTHETIARGLNKAIEGITKIKRGLAEMQIKELDQTRMSLAGNLFGMDRSEVVLEQREELEKIANLLDSSLLEEKA